MIRAMIPLLATAWLILNAPAAAGAEAPPRTVSTTGTSTVYVTPDEADLHFEVYNFDADLAAARAANDKACADVLSMLTSMKVEPRDVRTERLRTEAVYEQKQDKPRRLTGYTTARAYAVTLRDLSKFQALGDALLARSDCTLGHFALASSASRKHRDEARKMAVRAAREKAELLVGELGASLGPPRSINESYSGGGANRVSWSNSSRHGEWPEQSRLDGDDPDARPVPADHAPLGQIGITATISATFDLYPARE